MDKFLLISLLLAFIFGNGLTFAEVSPNNQAATNGNTIDTASADLLQKAVDNAITKERLIGLQVAVKTGAGKTWNSANGFADKKRTKPLEGDSPIRVGSITKTFTAVVIMHLIERGSLELDQSIAAWFPEIAESNKITIRNLLNHSSGIPEVLGMKIMLVSTLNPRKIWKPAELIKIMKSKKRGFSPGSKNQYSNSNYILLGLIAEKITGKPLQDLYREEILGPLGMKNTYFLPYENPPADLVNGFDRSFIPFPEGYEVKANNTSWSTCAYASGAMASTAGDLMIFYTAVMDQTIISEKSLALMTSFQSGPDNNEKYLKNFGSGLFQFDEFNDTTYGNLGLFIGSEALALYHPEKRYVITLIGNVSRFEKDELVREIIKVLN